MNAHNLNDTQCARDIQQIIFLWSQLEIEDGAVIQKEKWLLS